MPKHWVKNRSWDLFWLLSALWLTPLFFLLSQTSTNPDDSPAGFVYLLFTAVFWIGHRFASTYLAWFSPRYQPLRKLQPLRFLALPIIAVCAVFSWIIDPFSLFPGEPLQRAVLLGAIDYLLVSYHFASQHYGVLSLYRQRSHAPSETNIRFWDRLFAVSIGGALIVLIELMLGTALLPDSWLMVWEASIDVEAWWPFVCQVGIVLCIASTAAMLYMENQRAAPSLPRSLYIVNISVMTLAALLLSPALFIMLWTTQHWLAATGLCSTLATAAPADPPANTTSYISTRTWLLGLAFFSCLTMPLFEIEASAGSTDQPASVALPLWLLQWLQNETVIPYLLALGLATALLHYLLDRAVWRFSDATVRAAAKPLLEK